MGTYGISVTKYGRNCRKENDVKGKYFIHIDGIFKQNEGWSLRK